MRRLPGAGLVVMLLLGLSGCASVQQRLNWSSPSTTEPVRTDPPAPSRSSWWHRPEADPAKATGAWSGLTETTKDGPRSGDTTLPSNAWPDPPAEGFSRYFPLLSRRWDGSKTGRSDATSNGRSNGSQVSARSGKKTQPSVALDDRAVRTVDGSDAEEIGSGGGKSLLNQQGSRMSSPMPAPVVARAQPYALPEAISDVELDVSSRAIVPDDPPAPAEPKPTTIVSLQPGGVMVATSAGRGTVEPDSVPEQAGAESRSEPEAVEVSAVENDEEPLTMAPASNAKPAGIPTKDADLEAGNDDQQDEGRAAQEITHSVPAAPRADWIQIPPAPAPSFGPETVVPSPTADQSSVAPSQPVAPAERKKVDKAQVPPQPPLAARQPKRAQSIYASPPPVAPRQPRDSLFGWAGFRLPADPPASAQLPPATFPPSYQVPAPAPHVHDVSPTPQANAAESQPSPIFGGWKPVLIPALIKKIKNWGHGCGCQGCHHEGASSCCKSCTCCGVKSPAVSTSPQANVQASWQIP
jgi:hypothetical protein